MITNVLIVICIANYIREYYLERRMDHESAVIKAGAYSKFLVQRGQWWRLLTAGFVHFSPWHLLMNMYCLYNLGHFCESFFGTGIYLVLILGSIIAGNAMTYSIGRDNVVAGGMSSGIYGLLAAEIVILAIFNGGIQSVFRSASFMSMLFINILLNFMPGVGWHAHLGGATFGILFTVVLMKFIWGF